MANEELREANKERVLQAAIWCFLHMGIESTTRMSIAKKAGVTERSVQRYFGNLESLRLEAMKVFMRDYSTMLYTRYQERISEKDSGAERLKVFLKTYAYSIEIDDPKISLVAHEIEIHFIKNRIPFDCVNAGIYDANTRDNLIHELLQKGKTDGSINASVDIEKIYMYIITTFPGMLVRTAMLSRNDFYTGSDMLTRTIIDQYIDVLDGLINL
ncbi:MAG: TetR/AcrR family transcriptional regulator [Christensenella sp.]|nr:TetR/AcrR family transcriptional regulator [Christensenella sp.]